MITLYNYSLIQLLTYINKAMHFANLPQLIKPLQSKLRNPDTIKHISSKEL